MSQVTVKIEPAIKRTSINKKIMLIQGAKVTSARDGVTQIHGNTDSNGMLEFNLSAGTYFIGVESSNFIRPDDRVVIIDDSGNKSLRTFKVIDDIKDCDYIVKKLNGLIKTGEIDKAQTLLKLIEENYSGYRDIPQLQAVQPLMNDISPDENWK